MRSLSWSLTSLLYTIPGLLVAAGGFLQIVRLFASGHLHRDCPPDETQTDKRYDYGEEDRAPHTVGGTQHFAVWKPTGHPRLATRFGWVC